MPSEIRSPLRPSGLTTRTALAATLVSIFCVSGTAYSQPPGFDPSAMLRRADRDNDGKLEADELDGRMRGFIERMAGEAGVGGGFPYDLDRLASALERRRSGRDRDDDDDDDDRRRDWRRGRDDDDRRRDDDDDEEEGAVPGFGETNDLMIPPGFDGLGGTLTREQAEAKYGDRVVGYTERMLERYDRDKSGALEKNEWEGARWSSPPESSDLNKDGVLTKMELYQRLHGRFNDDDDDDDDDDRRRDDDDRRSAGPTRGSQTALAAGGSSLAPLTNRADGAAVAAKANDSVSRFVAARNESQSRTAAPTTSPAAGKPEMDERYVRYAQSLMRQYDRDKDGVLEKDEWSRMSGEPEAADYDGDGKLTEEEMAKRLQNKMSGNDSGNSGSTSRPAPAYGAERTGRTSKEAYEQSRSYAGGEGERPRYRFLTPVERLPSGLPDWFLEKDRDGDGQVGMYEFTQTWTDAEAAKFASQDSNADGFISAVEALAENEN